MKSRRLIASIIAAIAAALIAIMAFITYWQWKQPEFKAGLKLISAVQAFSRDATSGGLPLPATVSLTELIGGGYIAASDARAFDGIELTISLTADESLPQEIFIRARLPDGSLMAVLADGSVQGLQEGT